MDLKPGVGYFSVAMLVGLLLTGSFALTAKADDLSFAPSLEHAGWLHLELPGYDPATYSVNDQGTLIVASDAGTSILYRDVSGDPSTLGTLSWQWRVDKPVPVTDITQTDGDDRDLAVHVWFPREKPQGIAGMFGGLAKSVLGYPEPGRTLTYIWGSDLPVGTRFTNPHHAPDGAMIVLRQGGVVSDGWQHEKVNVFSDYQAIFGDAPTISPKFIAISTDSDDTGSMSRGKVCCMSLSP